MDSGAHDEMQMTRLVAYSTPLVALVAVTTMAAARQTERRLSVPAAQAQPERRLALVVGNDTYAGAPLRNARNDARAVAQAFGDVKYLFQTVG